MSISAYELITLNSSFILDQANKRMKFPDQDFFVEIKKSIKKGRLNTLKEMNQDQIRFLKTTKVPKEVVLEDARMVFEFLANIAESKHPKVDVLKNYLSQNADGFSVLLSDVGNKLHLTGYYGYKEG